MKNKLSQDYWEARYAKNETGWNIGYPSTPIKTYIDQLENKNLSILIPGSGNSYEAEYLWNCDFKNIFILDIASLPLENFKKRVKDFPESQLIHANFFELDTTFDLIIEQTFFCALDPELRPRYAEKMQQLLKPTGKLVGLLFDFELTTSGPPFGGSVKEYKSLFEDKFKIKLLEKSYNSIKERDGKELFFIFEKNN